MTNHMNAAVEAGARTVTPHLYYMYDEWDEATNEDRETAIEMSTQVIQAALPHIREMIAEEIRDANLPNDPVFYSGADGYHLGIKAAARIAKGLQQ